MIAIDGKRILLLFEKRDEQALREADATYGVLCRSTAHNILGSAEDAEETMQDALLAAWNTIPPAKPDSLKAYLLKLVRNLALDRYKASHREKRGGGQMPQVLEELSEILPSGESVESEVEKRELLRGITVFLERLPVSQRNLFVRRYYAAEEITVLAERFDMSESNVKVTLSRLRKRLQAYLRKEGLL